MSSQSERKTYPDFCGACCCWNPNGIRLEEFLRTQLCLERIIEKYYYYLQINSTGRYVHCMAEYCCRQRKIIAILNGEYYLLTGEILPTRDPPLKPGPGLLTAVRNVRELERCSYENYRKSASEETMPEKIRFLPDEKLRRIGFLETLILSAFQ